MHNPSVQQVKTLEFNVNASYCKIEVINIKSEDRSLSALTVRGVLTTGWHLISVYLLMDRTLAYVFSVSLFGVTDQMGFPKFKVGVLPIQSSLANEEQK